MTQSELIIKLAEVDADIGRQQIALEEATAKLEGLKARRRELEHHCTHRDGRGRSMVIGIACALCNLEDR